MSSDNDETIRDLYGVKKRVSVVWKYFEKLNRYRVRCRICAHEQNYQGTTGNILRHLKNKHNIDATIKGQSGAGADFNFKSFSANRKAEGVNKKIYQENDEEFDVIVKREHNDTGIHTSTPPFNTKADFNPYSEENGNAFLDYIEPYLFDTKPNLPKPSVSDVDNQNSNVPSLQFDNTKSDILEERLIAQIEYFREKAAFYRMQTNLTSLQAKKVRYELDQME